MYIKKQDILGYRGDIESCCLKIGVLERNDPHPKRYSCAVQGVDDAREGEVADLFGAFSCERLRGFC
jgi:hypothetical protein